VDRIVWSAHKYKTCADTFSWFAGVCENYDHLRRRVYQVYSGTTLVRQWDEKFVNGLNGTASTSLSLLDGDWKVTRGSASSFTLTFDGATTAAISTPTTATAATVRTALNNLAKGTFFVNGPAGGPWIVDPPDTTKALTVTGTGFTSVQQTTRRWGSIAQLRSGSSTPRHSGKLGGCSVADNQKPLVNGSYARMTRISTSGVDFVGTADRILDTFWDDIENESPDINASTTTGTFTVTESKPYIISARVRINSELLTNINLKLQVNGVTKQFGPTFYNSRGVGASWVQYLNAGEAVRLVIQHTGGNSTGGVIRGSADEAESYFTIAGAG
jgi:hypothetical protein